jgi:hypothetical protein
LAFEVRDKLELTFEDAGEQQLRNIARPVIGHAVQPDSDLIPFSGNQRSRLLSAIAMTEIEESAGEERRTAVWSGVDQAHRHEGIPSVCDKMENHLGIAHQFQRLGQGSLGYGRESIGLCIGTVERPVQADEKSGLHICFSAPDPDSDGAFHEAAVAAGGGDNGAPGLRPDYADDYFAAYVIDPDGYRRGVLPLYGLTRSAAATTALRRLTEEIGTTTLSALDGYRVWS